MIAGLEARNVGQRGGIEARNVGRKTRSLQARSISIAGRYTYVSTGKIGDEETQKRDDRNTTYKRLWGCWQKTMTLPAPCVTTRSCISSLEAMQTPWKRGERDG
jgi:hypothetical protein